MPNETVPEGRAPSIGVVIDMADPKTHPSWPGKGRRVGIMWTDGGGVIDYEPKDWLEVISESRWPALV